MSIYKISNYTKIILILTFGVVLVSIGVFFTTRYTIPGDGGLIIYYTKFIEDPHINLANEAKNHSYPLSWGYVTYGLSILSGIPYININALMAPFTYLFIFSIYLMMSTILKDYHKIYSVLSTILMSMFSGLFIFFTSNSAIPYSNIGNTSWLIFNGLIEFRYKSFSYCLLFMSISLFLILNQSKNLINNKFRKERERFLNFKILFLSSFVLLFSLLIYILPFIIGIYILFLYTLAYRKKFRFVLQLFFLFSILNIVLFILFDFFMNFYLSNLIFDRILINLILDNLNTSLQIKITLVYSVLLVYLIGTYFLSKLLSKNIDLKYKSKSKIKLRKSILYLTMLCLFSIILFIEIIVIFVEEFILHSAFGQINYFYYYLDKIFLNIGFIGILAVYLSYYCYKKDKDLFHFLFLWISISLIFASLLIFKSFIFDYPLKTILDIPSGQISNMEFWYERFWSDSIPAFSILASFGLIEIAKRTKTITYTFNYKIKILNRMLKVKTKRFKLRLNLFKILKYPTIISIIFFSFSNSIIWGAHWGNTNWRLQDEQAQIIGWLSENSEKVGSKYLIINAYYPFWKDVGSMTPGGPNTLSNIQTEIGESLTKEILVEYLKNNSFYYFIFTERELNMIDLNISTILLEFYNISLYEYNGLAIYYSDF